MDAAETATSVPARAMLEKCGLLPSPPTNAIILDNACGAGIVTACLCESLDDSQRNALTVVCGDIDQTMVDLTSQRVRENVWKVQVERLDAQAVSYQDTHFSHVLMNFGPQLMSDPMLALKGMSLITDPLIIDVAKPKLQRLIESSAREAAWASLAGPIQAGCPPSKTLFPLSLRPRHSLAHGKTRMLSKQTSRL